ncbi:unnamed protein product [Ambrosiozyma monospora]|uniref:Unnamed protein product n=1 Tax=Ambrosiozyma monospora TaxID=43982 RepID=A0ACB5T630_AMBMO|nr:unnamed protein product [Ambrosiozyma monospora]
MSSSNNIQLSVFREHPIFQTIDQRDLESENFDMSSEDYDIHNQQPEMSPNEQRRLLNLEQAGGQNSTGLLEDDNLDHEFNLLRTIEYRGHQVVLESIDVTVSWKLKLQSITCFQYLLVVGFMDQAIGSIMHYMLEYYEVDRSQLSLLFLLQLFGYLAASFANDTLHRTIGFGNLTSFAMFCVMATCIGYYLKFPLTLMFILSIFLGFGIGTVDCCVNVFFGNMKYANQLLGVMHAFYGVGSLFSPILAIRLIEVGWKWNQYYLLLFGFSTTAFVFSVIMFRNETKWKASINVRIT